MNIVGFIDYYPGKSCFVYPVFSKDKGTFVVGIGNELVKFEVDEESNDYTFIKVDEYAVNGHTQNRYAFKRRKNEIVYGNKSDISKYLLLSLEDLKNDLDLHEEIAYFCNTSNINVQDYEDINLSLYDENLFDLLEKIAVTGYFADMACSNMDYKVAIEKLSENFYYAKRYNITVNEDKENEKKELLIKNRRKNFFNLYKEMFKKF